MEYKLIYIKLFKDNIIIKYYHKILFYMAN